MHNPEHCEIECNDGYRLHAVVWDDSQYHSGNERKIVVICPATSVHSKFYYNFANYLSMRGFTVVTFDYRGIGYSKLGSLQSFEASWITWGTVDFEAVLVYINHRFSGASIDVIAHSAGGFIVGLAESSYLISRMVTVGAQYAYWADYRLKSLPLMIIKWHLVAPLLAFLLGYFPGKRLGWVEDTPLGVVKEWSAPYRRFEDWYKFKFSLYSKEKLLELSRRMNSLSARILAITIMDDDFGTPRAVLRLHRYFEASKIDYVYIYPKLFKRDSIGHFAFFKEINKDNLWPIALNWLQYRSSDTAYLMGGKANGI